MNLLKAPGKVGPLWLVCLASPLVGGAIVWFGGLAAFVVLTTFGVMMLVLTVRRLIRWPDDPDAQPRILRWTILALAVHLLFGLVVVGLDIPIFYELRGDEAGYHSKAIDLLQHWQAGFPMPHLPSGKEGFYYVLAALYWVFGPYNVTGLAFNAVLAAALVPLLSDLTYRLFGRASARYVAPMVVFLPGLFLWTSLILKESAVLFLISLAAYSSVRLLDRVALWPFLSFSLALALLLTFRGYVGFVVALCLAAGMVVGRQQLLVGLNTALTALALLAALVLTFGLGYSGYRVTTESNLEDATRVRQDLATSGSSGFDLQADVSTPERAISYLPTGLIKFGLGPFPWQVRSVRYLPALPDVLVLWALLPSLCRGLAAAWRRIGRKMIVFVLPSMALLFLFALVVGNFGTVVRERQQVIVLMLPFIALGLAERRAERAPVGAEEPVSVTA